MSDLTKYEARQLVKNVEDLTRVSELLAKSGYFTDARDAAQAGVKVLAGLEMGIGAFSAMAGIHVIKGKPTIGAGLMAAAVKRSGKYNYRVATHTHMACSIVFFERGEECGTSTFTVEDAKAAGLLNNDNWKKAPRNMLFARALSNGVRWYTPDVFDVSTYVPEELGAEVDEEGNMLRVPTTATVPVVTEKPKEQEEEKTVEATAAESLEEPITRQQIDLIMRIFGIAKIDPKTPAGKEEAADLLSHIMDRPVTTMRGMTRQDAEKFLASFLDDSGALDETEVHFVMMEVREEKL